MNLDFRPAERDGVTLFRHWGDAVIFWICLAALLIVCALAVFRYAALRTVIDRYRELDAVPAVELGPIERRLETLQVEVDSLRAHNERLRRELEALPPPSGEDVVPDPLPTPDPPDRPSRTIVLPPPE